MRDHDAFQSFSAPVPFTVFAHQEGERQHLLMLALCFHLIWYVSS